jgi:hypothetical protein
MSDWSVVSSGSSEDSAIGSPKSEGGFARVHERSIPTVTAGADGNRTPLATWLEAQAITHRPSPGRDTASTNLDEVQINPESAVEQVQRSGRSPNQRVTSSNLEQLVEGGDISVIYFFEINVTQNEFSFGEDEKISEQL